jgi:UBX domain
MLPSSLRCRAVEAAEQQRGGAFFDEEGDEKEGVVFNAPSGGGASPGLSGDAGAVNRSHRPHEANPPLREKRGGVVGSTAAAFPVGPKDRTSRRPPTSGGRLPYGDDVELSPQAAAAGGAAADTSVPGGRKHSALVAVTVLMRSGLRLQHHFNVSETLQTVQNWGRSSRAIAADDSEEFVILQPATRFTPSNLRRTLEELKLPTDVHLSVVKRMSRPPAALSTVDTSDSVQQAPFL